MENPAGHPMSFPTMNLDFYPNERGPYNFETGPSAYSAGLTVDGGLLDPDSRWGGIMCALPELDYQYHYLDLWLMDPSQDYPGVTGKLYIDIGQITEDILQDGQWAAEHFTKDDPDTTAWGFVRPLYSYSNFSAGFSYDQDVGLDELSSDEECSFYFKYLDYVQQHCNESFYSATREDVSGDDFHYYLGKDYDELNYKVRERYKNWTGMEANSTRASVSYYISTRSPDSEDLNHNGKLDTINFYSEYEISIDPSNFVAGQNYFLEEHTFNGSNSDLRLENGKTYNSKFYHFIIPLDTAVPVNGIPFSAVRPEFMRIFLTGFNQEINLRIIDLRLSEKLPD
jgi:cell surface protein SprA